MTTERHTARRNSNLHGGYKNGKLLRHERLQGSLPHRSSSIGNGTLLPRNCAFIDTNNNPTAEEFLRSIGARQYERFGEPVYGYSGFCRYPLYEFPEDLLREMDADGYEKHCKSYGGAFLMAQRRMNAEMFGADLLE